MTPDKVKEVVAYVNEMEALRIDVAGCKDMLMVNFGPEGKRRKGIITGELSLDGMVYRVINNQEEIINKLKEANAKSEETYT